MPSTIEHVKKIKALLAKHPSEEVVKKEIQTIVNSLSEPERKTIETDFKHSIDFGNPQHTYIHSHLKSVDEIISRFSTTDKPDILSFLIAYALSLACHEKSLLKDVKATTAKKISLNIDKHIEEVQARLDQGYAAVKEYLSSCPDNEIKALIVELCSTITNNDKDYNFILTIKDPKELIERVRPVKPESAIDIFTIKRIIVLTCINMINEEALKVNKAEIRDTELLTDKGFDDLVTKMSELLQTDTYINSTKLGKAELFKSQILILPMLTRFEMDGTYSGRVDSAIEIKHNIRTRFGDTNLHELLSNIADTTDPNLKRYKIMTAIAMAHRALIFRDPNLGKRNKTNSSASKNYLFFRILENRLNKKKAFEQDVKFEPLPLEKEQIEKNRKKETKRK